MGKKPLEIDMIAGSQLRDTQGELLSVEGADISELEAGRGRLNDNHGKGFFNSIGRVTYAKKIYNEGDCDDDRQKYYWEKVKSPYIYVKGVLYDDDDHPNARAAAAILRNIHKTDCPLRLKASVEGGVLARGMRDEALLARTKIHSVALTFTPANNATLVEPTTLEKSSNEAEDWALIKSVMHLAKSDVPSFRHITRRASAEKISENLRKAQELAEAAGLKTKIPSVDPDELIKHALGDRISENVKKIHELTKAIAGKNAHAYNYGTTQPNGAKVRGYTGDDAKKAQIHTVKHMINDPHISVSKPYKTMENIETGKPELHIMVHHGVSNSTGDKKGTAHKRNAGSEEHNSFSVKNGIVDHPTYGVHTLDHNAANNYTDESKNGGIHSFWVPVSKVHGMRNYENARYKNTNQALPDNYAKDIKDIGDDADFRDTLGYDPQAHEESHIVIRPGKFKQASKQDIEKLHEKIDAYHKKHQDTEDPDIQNVLDFYKSPLDKEQGYRFFTSDGVVGNKKDKHPFAEYGPEAMKEWDEYVKRQRATEKLKAEERKNKKLTKALTAGYGGAGAPTSMTGGSVIQSESLDDGRGFKYIGCDDCGSEQVYMKHQIKCRSCGKHFPFNKLAKIMIF